MYLAHRLSGNEIALQHPDAPASVVMLWSHDEGRWKPAYSLYPNGNTKALPSCFNLRPEGWDALKAFIEDEKQRAQEGRETREAWDEHGRLWGGDEG